MDWSRCSAVDRSPGKLGGIWCCRGTRLPVATLFEHLDQGSALTSFWNGSRPLIESRSITCLPSPGVRSIRPRRLREDPVRRQHPSPVRPVFARTRSGAGGRIGLAGGWRMARCLTRPGKRGSTCCSPAIKTSDTSRILRAVSWLLSSCPRITGRSCGQLRRESPQPSISCKPGRWSGSMWRCCEACRALTGRRRRPAHSPQKIIRCSMPPDRAAASHPLHSPAGFPARRW
jgi:Protein of unknown function (DUF433)